MKPWLFRYFGLTGSLFFCGIQLTSGQIAPSNFDSRSIENSSVISDGTCSNTVVGISYRLPNGMTPEDPATMHMVARRGALSQGIGPEARYFLYGYGEAKTTAAICGAANKDGQVQILAASPTLLASTVPDNLENIVANLAKALRAQPTFLGQQTINGNSFERADVSTEVNSPTRGKVEIHASFYAAKINSYIIIWTLAGYSQQEWKQLIAGMDSIKVSPPQSVPSSTSVSATPAAKKMTPDFHASLDEFLKDWLSMRDRTKTMAFFDPNAYTAPPLIGTYCSGWYKKGAPAKQAEKYISDNLMGVPSDFPKNAPPVAIFKAVDRLPIQWVIAAANDVGADHFLVAQIDSESVDRMFSGVFAGSDYEKFLQAEIRKGAGLYLGVFPELAPDGDVFVIFTLWQKGQDANSDWRIIHMDVVCQ